MVKITEEDKWNAVVECDENYDGIFYYGVKTTKIFCRPSCKSRLPLRKNVLFFKEHEQAIEKGFRPCKRCRPDLLSYDPSKELIVEVKDFIKSNYQKPLSIDGIAQNFGVSTSHLSKLFKDIENISIINFITKTRISSSLELLKNKELEIIEIAYSVGFESLSNYYRCFKKEMHLTPKGYRDLNS